MAEFKPDNWMPLYIGDYLSDTMHLTTEQHGAYLLLIMAAFKAGGSLPDDEEKLANLTKLSRYFFRKHRPILAEFFTVADGVWKHKRVMHEVERAFHIQLSNKQKARKAADTRWQKHRTSGNASGNAPSIDQPMLQAMLPDAPLPLPIPIPKDKEKRQLLPEPVGFVAFWKAWPSHKRKADRQTSLRRWIALGCEPRAAEIVEKVEAWKRSPDWTKDDGEYIPAPEVWLNKRKFDAPAPKRATQPALAGSGWGRTI